MVTPTSPVARYFSLSLVRQQSKVKTQVDRGTFSHVHRTSHPPVTPTNAHVPPHTLSYTCLIITSKQEHGT